MRQMSPPVDDCTSVHTAKERCRQLFYGLFDQRAATSESRFQVTRLRSSPE